jgi:glycine oxidase
VNLSAPAADFLIVGQGLAGTLLAWEFERAGISFAIVDSGHEQAASRVAAGIINPITGRRLVPSWRVAALLPAARTAYRELEAALGVSLWREMRVWRIFADERERRVLAEKQARGELGAFAGAATEQGFWIEGAARIDLPELLRAARERWRAQGRLRVGGLSEPGELLAAAERHQLVIDCTGLAGARSGLFDFVPWEFSKGQLLTLSVTRGTLDSGVIVNRGHWLFPLSSETACLGATHEPGVSDTRSTAEAQATLAASMPFLQPGQPYTVTGQLAGVRVTLPDKRPVVGRHPVKARVGVVNGLGAKGALLAPMLARQWVNHLTEGVPFDPAVDVARFSVRNSSQALSL